MITAIFCFVYLGMFLGNLPGLAIDRTGIALIAGILVLLLAGFTSTELANAIDWSTIAMLFGLMILSAQFFYSGFYRLIVEKIEAIMIKPQFFLLLVIMISGILSAVLVNDIVCLAFVPLFIHICQKKSWNPRPFLLGLAASANVGSAITLIGNPQNILISESIDLSFSGYFTSAALPAFIGLFWVWGILCYLSKNNWYLESKPPQEKFHAHGYETWQIIKGIGILAILLALFFFTTLPRYQLVLAAAALLLLSRKMTSEKMLGFIDWQVLLLFLGLFLINAAFLNTETATSLISWLQDRGLNLSSPIQLFVASLVLTNLVSNVPAVMLLLPFVETPFQATLLALSSTLGGNLLLVGSIANLIVVSKAKKFGIHISWKDHLKAGIPIGVGTLALAILWLMIV